MSSVFIECHLFALNVIYLHRMSSVCIECHLFSSNVICLHLMSSVCIKWRLFSSNVISFHRMSSVLIECPFHSSNVIYFHWISSVCIECRLFSLNVCFHHMSFPFIECRLLIESCQFSLNFICCHSMQLDEVESRLIWMKPTKRELTIIVACVSFTKCHVMLLKTCERYCQHGLVELYLTRRFYFQHPLKFAYCQYVHMVYSPCLWQQMPVYTDRPVGNIYL